MAEIPDQVRDDVEGIRVEILNRVQDDVGL